MRTYSDIEQMAAQDYSIGLTAHYKPLADLINERGYKRIIEVGLHQKTNYFNPLIDWINNMQVVKDCFCEGYIHELSKGRTGLQEKKLREGDTVIFVKEWSNLYGTYYRVKKDGTEYDIKPENLKS